MFEDISLKLKYGGASAKLEEATLRGISQAVQNLLPSMAFLRRPSYIGVTGQYRGRHGFSAVLPATLYQAGHRPREKFAAMQYFHLGHRIEDVVKREQEIAEQEYRESQK